MTQPSQPRSAKIELLVRRDDDEGFELHRIGSAVAFSQSRPQRVEDDTFELAEVKSRMGGGPSHILKNTRTDRFLLLSERERFLWDQMDGNRSLEEMATAYVLKYGAFDFEVIPNLIRKLQRAQLITLNPPSRLRQALDRNRRRVVVRAIVRALSVLERITISSRSVHPFFQRLYRWGGFLLFTPPAAVVCAALAVAGLGAAVELWRSADEIGAGLGANPLAAIVTIKLLFWVTVAAHQVLHGLALIHFRRRVREFGFTLLHGVLPTFYVDVTDIFMTGRRGRVVTAIAGPLVHLVLGSLLFIVAARLPPGFAQAFLATSGLLQFQALVVALYPFCFFEMDGYHVVVDALGVPTLKHDALAYVGALLRGVRRGPFTREQGLWIGYVVLSTLSVAAFIAFNVLVIVRATG
ncbi:MAG: hypothetical protein HY727_08485 [Candidatus Rokubacteria bacterium]|nr:hypothetical protein [Candidatus Rokubacteria bacterium]